MSACVCLCTRSIIQIYYIDIYLKGGQESNGPGGGGSKQNSELLSIHTNYNTLCKFMLCTSIINFVSFFHFFFQVFLFSILFKIFSKLSPVITRTTTLCSCPLFSFKTLPAWQGPTYFGPQFVCVCVSVCQCLVCLFVCLCLCVQVV